MRTVARYDFTFAPSRSISSSPTRAHRIPRTVFAASATAFEAAFAKLCGEVPTMSMIFWTIRFTHRAMATRALVRFASGFRPGLAGLDLSRVRELLQDRREPGSLLPHRLDVLLEERPPLPRRRVPVRRVQSRCRLQRLEPAVVQGLNQEASLRGRVVHVRDPLDVFDDRGHPTAEHRRVFAPLDLEGSALVLADRLEPRPRGLERAPDQTGVAEDVGELRVGVRGQLEEAVERAAAECLPLRARVVQEAHERFGVRVRRRRGHADAAALGGLEQERDRDVRAAAGEEVQVGGGRGLVEGVDVLVKRPRVLRGHRRFRDFLETFDLSPELTDPRLHAFVRFPVRPLELADLRPLSGELIELPPRLPCAVEVPLPRLPQRHVEPRDETRREPFLLRGFREVRGNRVDVPREDPHLPPVVHLALPDQAVDPLAETVERAIDEARDPVDPVPSPLDRLEELPRLRLERLRGRRVGGRHRSFAMDPTLFRFRSDDARTADSARTKEKRGVAGGDQATWVRDQGFVCTWMFPPARYAPESPVGW